MVRASSQRVESRDRGFEGPAPGLVANQMRFVEYEQPELVEEGLLVCAKAGRELLRGHDDHIGMVAKRVAERAVLDDTTAQRPTVGGPAPRVSRGRGCGSARRSRHWCRPLRGAGRQASWASRVLPALVGEREHRSSHVDLEGLLAVSVSRLTCGGHSVITGGSPSVMAWPTPVGVLSGRMAQTDERPKSSQRSTRWAATHRESRSRSEAGVVRCPGEDLPRFIERAGVAVGEIPLQQADTFDDSSSAGQPRAEQFSVRRGKQNGLRLNRQ